MCMSIRRMIFHLECRFTCSKFYIKISKIKDFVKRKLGLDICYSCIVFLRDYKNPDFYMEENDSAPYYIYNDKFIDNYKRLMRRILIVKFKLYGDLDNFIERAAYGNWEHFHETKEEKEKSFEELFEHLCHEISYCSDRWSWDRVIRVNWLYQRLKDRME